MALDDGGGEAHALEYRHLGRDLARGRGEAALVVAGAVSGALVGALVGPGADELVGLLVEHGVDGLLDGFPDQLAQFVFHGLRPGMIELDTQIIPTARAMSFLFSGRVQLLGCAKNFALPFG